MIWMIVAAVAAGFIKGLCGFGDTLTFATIMSFKFNNINISPMELVRSYFTNIVIVWKERKLLNLKLCFPILMLILIGDIPGIFMLKSIDSSMIKIIFGFVVILLGLEMLFRDKIGGNRGESKIILNGLGILSGMLCGLYGIGVLVAAYMSRVTKDNHAFKANLCFVFLIESTFRIIIYSCVGILTLKIVMESLILIPLSLIGLFIGIKSGEILDEKVVSKAVMVLLILSGIMLIVNNL